MISNNFYSKSDNIENDIVDKVVQIKRVSKKTKGGNQIAFTALAVSGDRKSRVGVGRGRAKSVAGAIQKATSKARKSMVSIPIVNGTISQEVRLKYKAATILIRPGRPGSGLIAGGPVRSVVELAGIKDLASKIIGSRNKAVNVWATLRALSSLKR